MSQIKTKFITTNAVTNPKLAQIPAHSYKGNNTGSTANAADITSTQLTADLNAFTSSLQGVVPSSGGGTTNFLRADGTFAAPSGASTARTINAQTGTTYTFVLADGSGNGTNPFITFNNASNQIITVPTNASVAFPVGTEIDMMQIGAGSAQVLGASGVTVNSYLGNNAFLGQYTEVSLLKTATNTWELYGQLTSGFITATGGTITTNGNFKVHTFNSNGTFQITSGYGTVASLLVGGGGAGGAGTGSASLGAGGAGGVLYTTPGSGIGVGSYGVVVGAGATPSPGNIVNGANSTFNSLTATGGGGGANSGTSTAPGNGGSGGGGAGTASPQTTGGTGTAGQGNAGGNGVTLAGGGGGGANAVGANASGTTGGNGGAGIANSITGSSVTYGGGGGGGGTVTAGTGGTGGGGNGATSGSGGAGTANTGGGGGGSSSSANAGGSGGSGVVIVTYQFQ